MGMASSRRRSASSRYRPWRFIWSTAEKGSSSSSSFGSRASARATATRCCCRPTGRRPARLLRRRQAHVVQPARACRGAARAAGAAATAPRCPPRPGAASARSSGTPGRHGAAAAADRCLAPCRTQTSSPTATRPDCGRIRPASTRISEVLPAPDGPTSASSSPASQRSCRAAAWARLLDLERRPCCRAARRRIAQGRAARRRTAHRRSASRADAKNDAPTASSENTSSSSAIWLAPARSKDCTRS
jgi:hypothetical protein